MEGTIPRMAMHGHGPRMYPQHQGASSSSYQSISAWDTRMKVASMVKEVREGEG